MRTTQLGIASSQPTNNGPVRANPRGHPRRLTEDGQVLILMLRRGRVALHDPARSGSHPAHFHDVTVTTLPRAPRLRPGPRAGPHGVRDLLHIQRRS